VNLATFRKRIAECLGWSVKDTRSFSLPTLRELVKDKDPELAAQFNDFLKSGRHIISFD
jgi:hypothetical protein